MWILVFLTYGLSIEAGVYNNELDCVEVASILNNHTINAEYVCEIGE